MLKLYILSILVCPPIQNDNACVVLQDRYSPQRTMSACLDHGRITVQELASLGYKVINWGCDEKIIR